MPSHRRTSRCRPEEFEERRGRRADWKGEFPANHDRRANKYERATPAAPTASMSTTKGTVLFSPDSEN